MRPLGRVERRLLRDGGLTTAGQILRLGLRLGVQLALARLLLPEDFGRFGLALLVMMLLAEISEGGVGPATVRAGAGDRVTSTALALAGALGLAVTALAWLISPVVAAIYGDAALTGLIQIMSLGLLTGALAVAPAAVLERQQRFDRRVLADVGAAATGAALTLLLAFQGAGAFALAWGWVGGEVVGLALLWWLAGWRPRARPSLATARELLAFGRFTAGSGLLVILVSNIDDAVVGKVLGLEALGFYGLAYGWANLLWRVAAGPLSKVLFPSYLSASGDRRQLADLYMTVLRAGAAVTMPAAALLMLLGPTMVAALLGPTWTPVGPLLQVLGVLLLARGLSISQGSLLSALDRPHWRVAALLLELAILVAGLTTAAQTGGLTAVAWLVSGAAWVTTGTGLALAQIGLRLRPWRLAAALGRPALATLAAAVVVLTATPLWSALPPLLALAAAGGGFAAVYLPALLAGPSRPVLAAAGRAPSDEARLAARSRDAGA